LKKSTHLTFILLLVGFILNSVYASNNNSTVTKSRNIEQYLNQLKNQEFVMVVGTGHTYDKSVCNNTGYPPNFYLTDNNKSNNVCPDHIGDITKQSEFSDLFNEKFNKVIFEYVYSGAMNKHAFENAYRFLKKGGELIFDLPDDVESILEFGSDFETLLNQGKIKSLHESIYYYPSNDKYPYTFYINAVENTSEFNKLREIAIEKKFQLFQTMLKEIGFKHIEKVKFEAIQVYWHSPSGDSADGFIRATK